MWAFIYYTVVALTTIVVWPHTYGGRGRSRLLWWPLGFASVALPLILPLRVGIYFGLAFTTTAFFWASDTHMGSRWSPGSRRCRALVGGTVSLPSALGLVVALKHTSKFCAGADAGPFADLRSFHATCTQAS